jgi:hypothetical protein
VRRRELLCVAGATGVGCLGVAGCVGREGASAGDRLVVTGFETEPAGSASLSFAATVVQPSPSTGARLRLALSNDGDRAVRLFTGAPPPFAVVSVTPGDAGAAADRYLLWTDAYRESDHVFTSGRRVTGGEDVGVVETVPAGDRVAETYELVGDPPPGEYTLTERLSVTAGDDATGATDATERQFTVRVRLRVA